MKPQLRRGLPVAGFVLVVALASAVSGSGATRATGLRVGQPWTGAAGIRRTTREIMQAPSSRHARRALPEFDANLQRHPNPNALPSKTDRAIGAALTGPRFALGTSFTGATLAEEESSTGGFVPPDSMGAVGPTQFLVAVNGKVKVFDKSGTLGTLNTSLNSFFSSVVSSGVDVQTTDPRVRYDPLSGKWIVTCIDEDAGVAHPVDNRFLIAVSDSATITNSTVWTFFQFQQNLVSTTGDTNDFADFDTLGVDANALYMGANIFSNTGSFVNSSVFVIRKSSVTGAGPIVVTAFRDVLDTGANFAGPYTPQGVDNDNAAATEGYFVGIDGAEYGKLDVLRVGTPGGTPTLSASLPVTLPQDSIPNSVPAKGSTLNLDAVDSRLTSASIRNGKLYTVEAIAVNSSGVVPVDGSGNPINVDRDAARWYELTNLTSTPSLSRSGTIFDSSTAKKSYWMPSMAVSPQGHAVLGMSTSSSTQQPNAAYSTMLSGTSTFSAPTTYTSASADYNVDTGGSTYRWGDYSHTSVDPCDGQTFWTIQEYTDGTDSWGVKVGKVLAPPPATPASTSPTSVNAGATSVSVTLTGTSTSGSGFWDPGSGSCRIAASVSGGVTVNAVTYTDPTHVTLDLNTVGASGGSHTVTITNPDSQTASASVLTVNTSPANTALPTVTGTTKVGSVLTVNTGTWTGSPAPTFTQQWERCDLAGSNCSDISGATNTTYTLVQADHATTIRVKVTGTNAAGSSSAESAQTTEIQYLPINTGAPTISGTASKGQTLTAGNGTWDAFPSSLTFAYQWQRCSSPGTCSDISGATASTYLLASADVGMTMRLQVKATNTIGTSAASNSAETVAVTAAPANTALPTISGLSQVGATLTASTGTWTGSPTPAFTYQWEQCNSSGAICSDISGETNNTYVLAGGDAGHTIRVKVTATNTVSSTTAESAATAVITVPPANTVLPSITGTAAVGQMLTGNDGTWTGTPTPTLSRKWRRCDTGGANCVDIAGATGTTYTLVQADAGSTIVLRVTATSTSGTTSADSNATAIVTGPPVVATIPAITGTASRGQLLTASNGTWTGFPAPTFTYQWRQCDSGGASCSDIVTATASTYTPVAADEGKTIRVAVTATNGNGTATATSNATAVVTGSPQNSGAPTLSGTAAKGQQLTTTNGTWTGFPASFTFTYAWLRCDNLGANCSIIGGATASTYTLVQADVGGTVKARVTATNTGGAASADTSVTEVVTGSPANTVAPTITGTTNVGDTLTEHDGTWSGYPDPTFSYQWRRCDSAGVNCTDIVGATAGTYLIASGDAGYRLRVTVTATNTSGFASADSDTADVAGAVTNLAAPTITGTAQVGATLTAHDGSWTGVPAPTFTYQWQRCDSAGANCVDIAAATAATYHPVSGDIGSTLVVVVSADNGGGPVATPSAATAAVVAAPTSGGGGGGGGGGLPPDVVASISASPVNPGIGSTLTYTVQASILAGNATDVVATINLPTQVTFVSATADRGSGCTGTTTLTCNLDFLNGSLVATVQVVTQVTQAGTLVATASMTTTPGDSNTANNTATSTITVAAPPPPPPPPPVLPAPVLKRIGTAPLVGVRHVTTETVDARFRTNEALQLTATVTALRSTKKLTMAAKSRLAGTTAASSRLTLRGKASRAGAYAVHLVFGRKTLIHGHTYVIHLTAVNAKGKRTAIALRFKA